MEPVLDITMWAIICGVGFVAGFIDAVAGGGGMLTVPTLLASGLPPHVALGTNKLAATFGSFTASYTYYKKKLFNPLFWKYSLLATAVGAIMGTLAVSLISVELLEKVLPIIILATAAYAFFTKSIPCHTHTLPEKTPQLMTKQVAQGLTLGFYDGVAGPGTGAFWTTSNAALYRLNILMSCGIARSCNFVSNIFSLALFAYLGHINLLVGLSMGLFIMIGAWVGAHSAIKYGSKFIRPIFIGIVLILSLNLAYNAWF
ncbi:sulfite exporter TauE/SafE family protein [Thalassotalea atypica]|uniref:sulfite exporter TauE/SafE family protein n=1 Tax=Thalassotalea atypica TaxID=2054316 RepID=UPI0025740907|nr:TSUP family transporter [Thalassotalea atypica]